MGEAWYLDENREKEVNLTELAKPFPLKDIEWMITNGTVRKKGQTITAKCLAYVTARAVQARLDEVCGVAGWKVEFREGPAGGVLCGISVRAGDEWITKWDGAENTDVEPVKGGLSGAMKRAGAQFGIGRYLYYLPEHSAFVKGRGGGRYYYSGNAHEDGEKKRVRFSWDPPTMPDWALPEGGGEPTPEHIAPDGQVANSDLPCPVCESPCFDHRDDPATERLAGKKPILVCSNPACRDNDTNKPWAAWMDTWQNDMLAEIEAAHEAELIDAKERADAEKIVNDGVKLRTMLKIQARLNELAEGA